MFKFINYVFKNRAVPLKQQSTKQMSDCTKKRAATALIQENNVQTRQKSTTKSKKKIILSKKKLNYNSATRIAARPLWCLPFSLNNIKRMENSEK